MDAGYGQVALHNHVSNRFMKMGDHEPSACGGKGIRMSFSGHSCEGCEGLRLAGSTFSSSAVTRVTSSTMAGPGTPQSRSCSLLCVSRLLGWAPLVSCLPRDCDAKSRCSTGRPLSVPAIILCPHGRSACPKPQGHDSLADEELERAAPGLI